MSYTFKKLSDVKALNEYKDNLNIIIEDGGNIAKISSNLLLPEKEEQSPPFIVSAEVGQIIKVKAINNEGIPIEWEAVDQWVISSPNKQFKLTIDDEGVLTASEIE